MNAPLPPDEAQRLQALRRYAILDTPPEAAFERLTRLACRLFKVPMAAVDLLDEKRQWFKSSQGLPLGETPREVAFCAHAILSDQVLVVPDARQDARFADNPLVAGETGLRFYAGAPLRTPDGFNIGVLAIMDRAPRELSEDEISTLADLAALAVDEMELRLAATALREEAVQERQQATLDLERREEHFRSLIENASDIIAVVDSDGAMRYQSPSLERVLGYGTGELIGRSLFELVHPEDAAAVEAALSRVFRNPGAVQTAEYRFRHQDGSWRVLESVGKTVSRDAATSAVINSRDISQRRRNEEALRAAKDQLQVVLDTIPSGVSWISRDCKYLGVNRYLADLFARTPEDFIGQPIGFMGVSPGYAELVRGFLASDEQQAAFEFSVEMQGLWHTVWTTARKYDAGRAAVFVGTDITARKQAEQTLQHAHDELEIRVARRTDALAQANAKLHESRNSLQAIMDNTTSVIYLKDLQGRYLFVNRRFEELFNLTRDEIIGQNQYALFPAEAVDAFVANDQKVLEANGALEMEEEAPQADGVHTYISIKFPLYDADGTPYAVCGISTDITERKQTEEALRASEEQFHSLTEAIPQQVWTARPDGTLDYVNQRVVEQSGRSFEQIIGWGWAEIIHPDDLAETGARWAQSLQTGEPYQIEFRLKRASDQTYRWNLGRALPLRDGEGSIVKWFGTNTDITERKQIEESLRQSEARKSAILETALDCIITIDHEGKVLEWNPASERTFGYSREEATGQLLGELIVPEPLREQHYQGIARYLASGEGSLLGNRIEVPALRADGTEIVVELSVTAIATDGPPLFTAYVRDITARKQTDEALQAAKSEAERANRAKSEFLSRMSHELRTPLNAILGFGQLLEMDDLNDEQRQGVEQILKGGRHLLELVNEVLDIARIESEQQPLDIEPVPVAPTLAGALEMIQPLASTRGIELGGDWDAAVSLFVLADQRRLKQVLLNLLANAVKYNREGGTATLSCTATEAGRSRIAVSDTGMGIAPEKIGQLFTPFERLGADDSGIEGTGLGLALSKRLVEAMGGEIGVTSTWGEGSTFWIELPQAQGQAPSVQPAQDDRDTAAPQAARAGETQAVVLYIEDNLSNFGLVQTILRHRPEIKLLAAMQGRAGLDLAQRHRPNLILLDFHLPDINGDEVLRRLREDPETRDIPVIVVSADATPPQIERMRAAGANDYLTKPLNVKQFLEVLNEALNQGDSTR